MSKTAKKQWVEPKRFEMADISAKNCCGSLRPQDFFSSVKKNNGHVHHTMTCPKELSNIEGKIEIVLPMANLSAINENLGDDKKTKSFTQKIVVYGEYQKAYTATTNEINTILARVPSTTTAQGLRELLNTEMKTRRPAMTAEDIQDAVTANVRTGKVMTFELFRQVATRLLLTQHLEHLDPKGTNFMRFCAELIERYCDFLDANPELKEKIFGIIDLDEKQWQSKAIDKMEFRDGAKWERHPETHATMAKLIDYTKSPTVGLKLKTWPPKVDQEARPGQIIVDETGTVLGTAIYDYIADPMAPVPISTFKQFDQFTYAEGDNKRIEKAKPFFKLQGQIVIENPIFYWGGQKKAGGLQFKVTQLDVWRKFEMRGGPKPLTSEETHRKLLQAKAALAMLGGMDVIEESPEEFNDNGKRGADGDPSSDEGPAGKKAKTGD